MWLAAQYACKCLVNGARIYLPKSMKFRTHDEMCTDSREAITSGLAINRMLHVRLSPLWYLKDYDLIKHIPEDYMHLGPEGMAKKLLDMFFDKRNIGKPFYLRRALKSIDCNLVKQKLPHKFSRAPQNITKHLKHWKASEFRTWLLYYSLPLCFWIIYFLFTFITMLYFFVQSYSYSGNVTLMLHSKCWRTSVYFFQSYMVKVHVPWHKCTSSLASNPSCSIVGTTMYPFCFGFEHKNGMIKQLCHGTV